MDLGQWRSPTPTSLSSHWLLASRLLEQPGGPAAGRIAAITGGTGFIGSRLIRLLRDDGWTVRAMMRRHDPAISAMGVEIIAGDLGDVPALRRLVAGADWVVHVAGVVRASHARTFREVNVQGTADLIAACVAVAPGSRFLHVSSLSAREPTLSPYAASKSRGEQVVRECLAGRRPLIVRPPAVYGPGDKVTLPLFQQLERGFLIAPWCWRRRCRFSLIHVDDLARFIAALLRHGPERDEPLEPDDGAPAGYGWEDLAKLAATVLERPVRLFRLPRWIFATLALPVELLSRLRGRLPELSRDKVAELFHLDWVCGSAGLDGLDWHPRVRFQNGFAATAAWYKRAGCLGSKAVARERPGAPARER